MQGCCRLSETQRLVGKEQNRKRFFKLMQAVWRGDVKETTGLLSRHSELIYYRDFTFHLPQPTTSILDYARACNKDSITEVLIGSGAKASL